MFLCWDNGSQEGQIIVGCLFIDIGWAVGLLLNKDTERRRGSSQLIQTQFHKNQLAFHFADFWFWCYPLEGVYSPFPFESHGVPEPPDYREAQLTLYPSM